jgi:SH3 domain-containing protein
MKSRACVLAGIAGALVVASVRAETLYVIDELIVSVSSTADETGERVASIHSGDSVEVLDRHNAYSHVRLSSGTQGWVKTSYLSAALPLQRQLTAQIAELEQLHAQVARLQGEAAAARAAAPVTPARASDPAPPSVDPSAPLWRPIWQWALACCLAGLAGGFALGWRMLDRRIRRKYGGLRIY